MYYLTFVLTTLLAAVYLTSSITYVMLGSFAVRSSMGERLNALSKIVKTSLVSALLCAFFTGLFSNATAVEQITAGSSLLYMIIAVCCVVVVMTSFVVTLISVIKKSTSFTPSQKLSRVITLSVVGGVIALLLSWLLS